MNGYGLHQKLLGLSLKVCGHLVERFESFYLVGGVCGVFDVSKVSL
jgi:hypothetical protein